MKKSRFVTLSLAWVMGVLSMCGKEPEEIVAYDSWDECASAHSASECQDWSGTDATVPANATGNYAHGYRPHFVYFPSGGGYYGGRHYSNYSQFRSSPPTFSRPTAGSSTTSSSKSSSTSGTKSSSSSISRGGFGSSGSSSTS